MLAPTPTPQYAVKERSIAARSGQPVWPHSGLGSSGLLCSVFLPQTSLAHFSSDRLKAMKESKG